MHKKSIVLIVFLLITSLATAQTSTKNAVKGDKPTTSKSQVKSTKNDSKIAKIKRQLLNEKDDHDLIVEPMENYLALQMINNAMDFLGVNYRGGGTSKAGMDCSGMVTAVFNIFGMKLPRSSSDMAKVGEKLALKDVRKGDLVFFRTGGGKRINHVGLVVETDGDEIKFIHSSTSKGVIISSTKEPYYKKTFVQANRVL